MAETSNNFRQMWERTSLIQRVLLMAILLACVGAAAMLVGWAGKPHMVMLYSGVEPEEASRIVEKISDAGVPYELTDGGTTIKVPVDKVYSLRLTMASSGLPSGGQKGYQILDNAKIGTSPFKERINYIRALEGELAKTIGMFGSVAMARVQIVVPESTIFSKSKNNATASVAVQVKAGWSLGPGNVAAIVHMVAGSVEGLSPENVVVVDNKGNLLSGDGRNGQMARAGSFFDYKSNVERYLGKKAEDMLMAVLGPGMASVKVAAVVESISLTETKETYDSEGKVESSESETIDTSEPMPGGDGKAPSGNKTENKTSLTEYLVGKTVLQKQQIPGQVKSLSVAVFVDLSQPSKGEEQEGDEASPETIKLTIADVEEIVRSAIGLKETDTLIVKEASFHRDTTVVDMIGEEGGGMMSMLPDIAKQMSLGILVIGALLALKIFRKPKKVSEAEAATAAAALPESVGQLPGAVNLLPGAVGETNPALLRAQITNALQNNPDEVKRLFLSWAEAEKGGA